MKSSPCYINSLSILPKSYLGKFSKKEEKDSPCSKSRKYDSVLVQVHLHDSTDFRIRLNFLKIVRN